MTQELVCVTCKPLHLKSCEKMMKFSTNYYKIHSVLFQEGKEMKKLLSVLLALVLASSLSACSSEQPVEEGAKEETATE